VFAINQLDATRLRQGLAALEKQDKERAAMVRARARRSWSRLAPDFPGDSVSGILSDSKTSKLAFVNFANDEPCPALDPLTQACDLYQTRPLTCRVFGPPVRSENGLGTCELCFRGATESEIAECEMAVDPDDIESDLLQQAEHDTGITGETIVAFCLAT
jgi:Fe-S-cluster containining protein